MDTPLIAEMSNTSTSPSTMSAVQPISEESRTALALHHAADIAAAHAADTKIRCSDIVKLRLPITIETLFIWYLTGLLIIADWNRDEVRTRDGNATEFMKSLATNLSPGMFLAYWNNRASSCDDILPTKEKPIIVYEGGHRTRWTHEIFTNLVKYLNMSMETLTNLSSLPYSNRIRKSVVEMTVSTHPSGTVPLEFVKRDYYITNQFVCPLTAGELLCTTTDECTPLQANLVAAMRRTLKDRARDGHLEILRALVRGSAGQPSQMLQKKDALMSLPPLTATQVTKAEQTILALAAAEERIAKLFPVKTVQTRISNRQLDLPMDGTYVYAIASAPTDADRRRVVDDIVTFYEKFFADSAGWTAQTKFIKSEAVARSRYKDGETPFPIRWTRIVNLLRPPQAGSEVAPARVAPAVPR